MSYAAKITSKGQITIPAKLRDELGVEPGDKLSFTVEDDGTISVAKVEAPSFAELKGLVKLDKKISGEELDQWIETARGAIGTRA